MKLETAGAWWLNKLIVMLDLLLLLISLQCSIHMHALPLLWTLCTLSLWREKTGLSAFLKLIPCTSLIRCIRYHFTLLLWNPSPPQNYTSSSLPQHWRPPPALWQLCRFSFAGGSTSVREQALPGAIHIPQVGLSLWMMLLPNYLDSKPKKHPGTKK